MSHSSDVIADVRSVPEASATNSKAIIRCSEQRSPSLRYREFAHRQLNPFMSSPKETNLFQTIKSLSLQRWPWLLLVAVALALDGTALTLQHVFNVLPCNECIRFRLGVLGVGIAGLLGALAPRVPAFRLAGLAVWMGAMGWSLYRANLLLNLERVAREGGATGCARFKGFPSWLALDAWVPAMFEPRAMCGDVSWTFLGQSVTFWIWVALWGLALTAALVLVAQKMATFPAPAVGDTPGLRLEH